MQLSKKSLIKVMNIVGWLLIIIGSYFSFEIFDFNLITGYNELKDTVKLSSESDYMQKYLDKNFREVAINLVFSIGLFAVSLLSSLSLWYKSNMLKDSLVNDTITVDGNDIDNNGGGAIEEEIENENNEESRV